MMLERSEAAIPFSGEATRLVRALVACVATPKGVGVKVGYEVADGLSVGEISTMVVDVGLLVSVGAGVSVGALVAVAVAVGWLVLVANNVGVNVNVGTIVGVGVGVGISDNPNDTSGSGPVLFGGYMTDEMYTGVRLRCFKPRASTVKTKTITTKTLTANIAQIVKYSNGFTNSSFSIMPSICLPLITANKIAVESLYVVRLGSTAIHLYVIPYLRVVGSVNRSPGASNCSGGLARRTGVSRTTVARAGASFAG